MKRIASLLPGGTDIVLTLGAEGHLVGVSHECARQHPTLSRLPHLTRSRIDSSRSASAIDRQVRSALAAGEPLYEIDAALLRRLRPDLLLTQTACDVCAVSPAQVHKVAEGSPELADMQVIYLGPSCLDDVFEEVRQVAHGLELEAAGAAAIDRLQSKIRRIAQATPPEHRPRTVCLEWTEPLMAAGNWAPELFHLAGAHYGLGRARQHSPAITWDQLSDFDPQVLVIAPCGFDLPRSISTARELLQRPEWQRLSAVRAGQAWVLDGDRYLNRPGPWLVDTTEILAAILHPRQFGTPRSTAAVRLSTEA